MADGKTRFGEDALKLDMNENDLLVARDRLAAALRYASGEIEQEIDEVLKDPLLSQLLLSFILASPSNQVKLVGMISDAVAEKIGPALQEIDFEEDIEKAVDSVLWDKGFQDAEDIESIIDDKMSDYVDEDYLVSVLEELKDEVIPEIAAHQIDHRLGVVADLNLRGFWGRLKWLLTGR